MDRRYLLREAFIVPNGSRYALYIVTPSGSAWRLGPMYDYKLHARAVMRALGYSERDPETMPAIAPLTHQTDE